VKSASIGARRPSEVAAEVEAALARGCERFVLRRVNGGGMVDLERLGAARYAAGLQSVVELEGETAAVAATR
jgi:hypothetical protein